MKINLPYLMSDKDRHGNTRLFVRRFGRKIRLREEPGFDAFMKAYSQAVGALSAGIPAVRSPLKPAARGTLGWLAAEYFGSKEFDRLDSKATRRSVIESCLREPIKDGSSDTFRDCPVSYITAKKVKRLRDLKGGLPGAANNRLKYLSAMFGWGIEAELVSNNPVRDVKKMKYATDGFYTWTLDEVEAFRTKFPVGTKARLALELLLFVGVRRGDFVRLGPQHVRGAAIRFVPNKTRKKKAEAQEIPILPRLQEVLDASPTGDLAFFVTALGKPFTAAGFGNWFADRCKEAGVPGRAHGLRKAGATMAADEGATVHQLMAMYNWSTPHQAMTYTKKANQRKLAAETAAMIAVGQSGWIPR